MLPAMTKRKFSATGMFDPGRYVQKRSSKACNCCRHRKVRCDVVGIGIPCTNCSLDGVECLVTEGRQSKKSRAESSNVEPLLTHSFNGENDLRPSSMIRGDDLERLTEPFLSERNTADELDSLLLWEDEHTDHRSHMYSDRFGSQERLSGIGQLGISIPTQSYSLQSPGQPDIVLPEYITAIPGRMTSEDIASLQKKGAFVVPETTLRNELLRCYIQFVHPYLPLLDLEEFLMKIKKNDSRSTIGLLLFQAVMLAGIPYIDMHILTAHGYHSRKEARQAFFQRAKLLYDVYYEADRVNVVQSVLLMSVCWGTTDNPKDIWQLLGVAISLARTIGLDRDTSKSQLPGRKQRLWKRIWWSCYMKDRLIAMSMRQPSRIRDGDFNVAMLRLDDFETTPLPAELGHIIGRFAAVDDASTREILAKMCIAMANCCRCITPILASQNPVSTEKARAKQDTPDWLAHSSTVPDPYEILRCDRELEVWYKGLSDELRWFIPNSRERASKNDDNVIEIHRSLLTSVYLAASSMLHHPQTLSSSLNLETVPEVQELSVRRVREAAGLTTDIYCTLSAHDLLRYLPDTGVTALLPALISHFAETKSTDTATRQLSIRRFNFCMKTLRRLSDMYLCADSAISSFEAGTRKEGIPTGVAISPGPRNSTTANRQQSMFASTDDHTFTRHATLPPETDQMAKGSFQSSQVAQILMSNCTLTQQERHLFAALTPPSSETGSPASDSNKSSVLNSAEEAQAKRISQESSWAEQTTRSNASEDKTSYSCAHSVMIDD